MENTYAVHVSGNDEARIGTLTTNHAASCHGIPVLVIDGVAYGCLDTIVLGGAPIALRDCRTSARAIERVQAPADMDIFAAVLYESEHNSQADEAAHAALVAWRG